MLRLDGSPARGIRVLVRGKGPPGPSIYWIQESGWVGSADTGPDGVAVFDRLPSGPVEVAAREPGYLPADFPRVAMRDGTTSRVRIREEPGRPVVVRVIDWYDRPVVGARLSFRQGRRDVVPLDLDGTQDAGPVTTAGGLYLLPRAPEGELQIRAVHGTRVRTAHVTAAPHVEVRFP